MPEEHNDPQEILSAKVLEWLSDTGFPLEMRVARVFRECDPDLLSQGGQYVDLKTGAVRETDLEVLWIQLTERFAGLSLQLVVECKSGTTPWVLFADPATQEYVDLIYYGFAVAASSEPDDDFLVGRLHDQLADLGAPLFQGPTPACFGIAQMKRRSGPANQGSNEKNEAYDAVRQAASGAVAAVSGLKPNREPPGFAYAVPIVVTTHPLFIASLDSTDTPVVKPTLSGSIHIRPAGSAEAVLVHVVNEQGLPEFIEICQTTAQSFMQAQLEDSLASRPLRALRRLKNRIMKP